MIAFFGYTTFENLTVVD